MIARLFRTATSKVKMGSSYTVNPYDIFFSSDLKLRPFRADKRLMFVSISESLLKKTLSCVSLKSKSFMRDIDRD